MASQESTSGLTDDRRVSVNDMEPSTSPLEATQDVNTPRLSSHMVAPTSIDIQPPASQIGSTDIDEEKAMALEADLRTPRSEFPPITGVLMSSTAQACGQSPSTFASVSGHDISNAPFGSSTHSHSQSTNALFDLRPLSSPNTRQDSAEGGSVAGKSTKYSFDNPGQPLSTWRATSVHRSRPPTSDPTPPRPGSTSSLQSSTQKAHDSHDFQYPDQTYQALQSPTQAPPRPSRMPRTRSSHSSGFIQGISHYEPTSSGLYHQNSGSRTVGATPVQSPGLYSPRFSPNRDTSESDDGRASSQILHSTHMTEPKETHKLNKDFDPMTGRKFLNNYELIDKLGSGQHGTVKLGRNLDTSQFVAVKIVRRFSKKIRLGKAGNPNDTIKKEVAILKKARHPHVVSLFEVIDDEQFAKVYLVLEYVERGEIVWRKTTEKAVARFEMARLERERTQGFDEAFENQLLHDFNADVPMRRLEADHFLAERKREALDRLGPEFADSSTSAAESVWNFEHPDDSDRGRGPLDEVELPSTDDIRLSRADIYAVETSGQHPVSATPFLATATASNAAGSDMPASQPSSRPSSAFPSRHTSQPASQANSRPVTRPQTPSIDGQSHGPYIEDKSRNDMQLRMMLSRVLTEYDEVHGEAWTSDEEQHRYVPCLTLHQALEAFRDTVLGLEYLHYQGIIHRDIKPANLLWTHDYRVKISDFGVSYLGKPIRADSGHEDMPEADVSNRDEAIELAKTVGTPAFYAPELCDPRFFEVDPANARPEITGQIDVWALGVTLYGMIYGRLPFFDPNEFLMYEKIAREEVFIPHRRLKGVEHNGKAPTHHDKRPEDYLEYQEVDDTLRDLLKKLLKKKPGERISLKEVKHHPWVVSGIENKEMWLDETDPSRHSEGKKIEVSTQDVQDAVVEINFLEKFKTQLSNKVSQVWRSRSSRQRTGSSAKLSESAASSATTRDREDRRASLRGDEQIFSALRASREGADHPLSRSHATTPDPYHSPSYFRESGDSQHPNRTPMTDRSMNTDDSMRTVKASDTNRSRQSILPAHQLLPPDDIVSTSSTMVDSENSSSRLSGILSGASRRLVNSMRSRERGQSRPSPSASSHSSSADLNAQNTVADDFHASPSVGLSAAIAAGHVDPPQALRDLDEVNEPSPPRAVNTDNFRRAHEINDRRHQAEHAQSSRRAHHRRSVSSQADITCPPSPDDEPHFGRHQPRPASVAESTFAVSSSSDQIVSGESTAHSRIPSVVSGASSISATMDEDARVQPMSASDKSRAPASGSRSAGMHETIQDSLLTGNALTKAVTEDEAGYNGEAEEDSDDELLLMA